jgi:hypothetical protein
MTDSIELKLDENNQLFFKVQIEGTSTGPVTVRLVCEADTLDYTFRGEYTSAGEVVVDVPALGSTKMIKEGKSYPAKLEVMIENRYFVPLKFDVIFKESLKVFAEVANVTSKPAAVKLHEHVEETRVIPRTSNQIVVNASMLQKAIRPVVSTPAKEVTKPVYRTLRDRFPKKS